MPRAGEGVGGIGPDDRLQSIASSWLVLHLSREGRNQEQRRKTDRGNTVSGVPRIPSKDSDIHVRVGGCLTVQPRSRTSSWLYVRRPDVGQLRVQIGRAVDQRKIIFRLGNFA